LTITNKVAELKAAFSIVFFKILFLLFTIIDFPINLEIIKIMEGKK